MNLQNLPIPKPDLPTQWNYDESIQKVRAFAYRWNKLQEDSPEILKELWIARQKLSVRTGRPKKYGTKVPTYSWSGYCQDIGSSKQVVDRWLQAFREGRKRVTRLDFSDPAMQRAKMAVGQLRNIAPTDPQREEAFNYVERWIKGNRKGGIKK